MAVAIEVTRENPEPAILALVNPARKKGKTQMARETNADKIARLESELETTQAALDEANDRLAQIYDLSAEEIEPEDFEEEDSDLDETDPND
jgi:hypothetical protein